MYEKLGPLSRTVARMAGEVLAFVPLYVAVRRLDGTRGGEGRGCEGEAEPEGAVGPLYVAVRLDWQGDTGRGGQGA
jgi:hypothetical protein